MITNPYLATLPVDVMLRLVERTHDYESDLTTKIDRADNLYAAAQREAANDRDATITMARSIHRKQIAQIERDTIRAYLAAQAAKAADPESAPIPYTFVPRCEVCGNKLPFGSEHNTRCDNCTAGDFGG